MLIGYLDHRETIVLKRSAPLLRSTVPSKYKRAILQALEASRDYQSRSNLDSIRRHTRAILEDQGDHFQWNDIIFLRTVKSVVQDGDVELSANILAELSPSYKRKRADSLSQRMSIVLEPEAPVLPPSSPGESTKERPHRPMEHDKWKIIPKKIYDKAEFDSE
jgi:hypothetical protein